jgi:hypothetical protein
VLIQTLQENVGVLENKLYHMNMALERSYMTNEDNEENLRTTKTALVNTSGYCRFIEEQLFMARKGGEVIGVIASKSSTGKAKSSQSSKSFIDSFGFLPSTDVIDENHETAFPMMMDNRLLKDKNKSPAKGPENITTLENRLSNLIATLEDKLYSGNNDDNMSNFVDIATTVPKTVSNDNNSQNADDNSKQIKREAKEKVDKIRLELIHDVNICLEYIEEIYSLSSKKEKIRNQLQQWERDFFGLCGRNPDTADKKRSNIFSSICTEYMQVQRVIRDKYEESKMLLAQVEDIYIQFDEARGVVETLTGKRPEDFKYNIKLPHENMIVIENPYLNRKNDEEKDEKAKGNDNDSFINKSATTKKPSDESGVADIDFVKVTDEISKISEEIKEFETFLAKLCRDIDMLNEESKTIDLKVEGWISNFKKSNNNKDPKKVNKKGIAIFDEQSKIRQRLGELQKQRVSTISFMENSKTALRNLNKKLGRK